MRASETSRPPDVPATHACCTSTSATKRAGLPADPGESRPTVVWLRCILYAMPGLRACGWDRRTYVTSRTRTRRLRCNLGTSPALTAGLYQGALRRFSLSDCGPRILSSSAPCRGTMHVSAVKIFAPCHRARDRLYSMLTFQLLKISTPNTTHKRCGHDGPRWSAVFTTVHSHSRPGCHDVACRA